MGNKYAVIGKGDASEKAIKAALDDLPEDAEFICHKDGKGSDSQVVVWNWLIDNERTFSVFGNNVGKSLQEFATSCDFGTANEVIDKSTKVLILWEDTEDIEQAILYAASKSKEILELTNGLRSIEVEDDAPTAQEVNEASAESAASAYTPQQEDDEEESSGTFSREELTAMPAAAVKRYAKEQGVDIAGLTKAEIIDNLFSPALDLDVVLHDAEAVSEILAAEVVDKGIRPGVAQVVVVMNDGTTITFNGSKSTLQNIVDVL